MDLQSNNYSIAEIVKMLDRKELQINRNYQRDSRLWPIGPRSYFIDTILEKYPFPKIYFYEVYDRIRGEVRRELVDGQQRIGTIREFINGNFAISGESRFKGIKFADLDDDQVAGFMSYSVSVDVIRNANNGEILQMFRRMNSYTLPLNAAEQRHSTYQGAFKLFVNNIADDLSEFFSEYGVFTHRQVIRMADAELISDIALSIEKGVVSTSPKSLKVIYEKYDSCFEQANQLHTMIHGAIQEITTFQGLEKSYLMKPYALHMLIIAIMHLKHRIPALDVQFTLREPSRLGVVDPQAGDRLFALAQAHEAKESEGPHHEYVRGCLEATNRAKSRFARLKGLFGALGNPVDEVLDKSIVDSKS